MRLPQEDFCQVLNVPSARKYESHGGPGITDIKTLLGSATPEQDRFLFMKSQVLFWLLAPPMAMKNFSVFIEPEGRFRLTPFTTSYLSIQCLAAEASAEGTPSSLWA
jgi:serine/threonine-protein kinase HipA